MTPAEKLIVRLDKVKQPGAGRWLARCPAHEDKSPSLSIRETDDGTLLIKCWTGCGAADVVAAVGLELKDLFPENLDYRSPLRPGERWIPKDVLRCVASEALLVAIAANTVRQGKALQEADIDRVCLAENRLRAAAAEVGVYG